MRNPDSPMLVAMARCIAIILGLAVLGGCTAVPPRTTDLFPVPLPLFAVGDTYIFDHGITKRVVAVDGDRVRWNGGADSTRDVLLMSLAGSGLAVPSSRRADPLFPLIPGKVAVVPGFGISQGTRANSRVAPHGTWRCSVRGSVPVRTPAGSFDTAQVSCGAIDPAGETTTQRTYFYAPSIGFYVRLEEHTRGAALKVIELRQYRFGAPALPDSALSLRVIRLQDVLERLPSGIAATWHDPTGTAGGTIEAVRTLQTANQRWCREFREGISSNARHWDLAGLACRDLSGGWQVLYVAPI